MCCDGGNLVRCFINSWTYDTNPVSSPPEEAPSMRIAPSIHLTPSEHQQLERWARGRRTPARLVLRAKIALLAAAGHDNQHIAATLRTSRQTVGLWRQRFATQRLPGVARDAPRGGRPPKARQALTARILKTTTQTPPPAATHWSTRTLARHLRTNPTFVQRVWTAHGLQPHRVRDLQAQSGSALPGETGGCGGAVSAPTRACRGPVGG